MGRKRKRPRRKPIVNRASLLEAMRVISFEAHRWYWRRPSSIYEIGDFENAAITDILDYCPDILESPALVRTRARQSFIRVINSSKKLTEYEERDFKAAVTSAIEQAAEATMRAAVMKDALNSLNGSLTGDVAILAALLENPVEYFMWFVAVIRRQPNSALARASPFSVLTVAKYLRISPYRVRKSATKLRSLLAQSKEVI